MKQNSIIPAILLTLLISCSENKPPKQNTATNNPDSLQGKSTYVNPVDNKVYTTEGEFKEYGPEGGIKQEEGAVQPLIILLTDQQQIPDIISVEKLGNFVKGANTIAIKQLAEVKVRSQVLVQFTLYPAKKPTIHLSYEGAIPSTNLSAVFNKIEQYSSDIRTQKDSCVFQCLYKINEPKQ